MADGYECEGQMSIYEFLDKEPEERKWNRIPDTFPKELGYRYDLEMKLVYADGTELITAATYNRLCFIIPGARKDETPVKKYWRYKDEFREKEHFKNHIATFTDYGNIKILDFKAPNTSTYRIRFLFEEDYCRLHISGDLGELIASNYYNMTYEKFSDYVNDTGYFEEKIDCLSRSIYVYDYSKALEELRQRAADEGDWLEISDRYDYETNDEARLESIIDDILDDFSESTGISGDGYDALEEINPDAWEFAYDIGKTETGILDLYMLAFKLAQEQLQNKNTGVC